MANTDTDNPQEETLEILVGITPEKYAELQGRNISVYEMIGVSSASDRSHTTTVEAEQRIKTDARKKGCEVILNVIPSAVYNTSYSQINLYLIGIGLRIKQDNLP